MRISDWSSDVCSSDLALLLVVEIHPRSPSGRAEAACQSRAVRTYSEICAAAFGPRAWTYASATRQGWEYHEAFRTSFLQLGISRLSARCRTRITLRHSNIRRTPFRERSCPYG